MASADGNAVPPTETMNTEPGLCASGCGFFGNPSTGGMCSKCYKETIAKSAQAAPPAPKEPVVVPPAAPEPAAAAAAPTPPPPAPKEPEPVAATTASSSAAASDSAPAAPKVEAKVEPTPAAASPSAAQVRPPDSEADAEDEPPKKVQVNTSRCWTCNRKIGLLGFQCKCDFFFCAEHRYSDRHECAFNYKAQGKQLLTKANPTIAPKKMEGI